MSQRIITDTSINTIDVINLLKAVIKPGIISNKSNYFDGHFQKLLDDFFDAKSLEDYTKIENKCNRLFKHILKKSKTYHSKTWLPLIESLYYILGTCQLVQGKIAAAEAFFEECQHYILNHAPNENGKPSVSNESNLLLIAALSSLKYIAIINPTIKSAMKTLRFHADILPNIRALDTKHLRIDELHQLLTKLNNIRNATINGNKDKLSKDDQACVVIINRCLAKWRMFKDKVNKNQSDLNELTMSGCTLKNFLLKSPELFCLVPFKVSTLPTANLTKDDVRELLVDIIFEYLQGGVLYKQTNRALASNHYEMLIDMIIKTGENIPIINQLINHVVKEIDAISDMNEKHALFCELKMVLVEVFKKLNFDDGIHYIIDNDHNTIDCKILHASKKITQVELIIDKPLTDDEKNSIETLLSKLKSRILNNENNEAFQCELLYGELDRTEKCYDADFNFWMTILYFKLREFAKDTISINRSQKECYDKLILIYMKETFANKAETETDVDVFGRFKNKISEIYDVTSLKYIQAFFADYKKIKPEIDALTAAKKTITNPPTNIINTIPLNAPIKAQTQEKAKSQETENKKIEQLREMEARLLLEREELNQKVNNLAKATEDLRKEGERIRKEAEAKLKKEQKDQAAEAKRQEDERKQEEEKRQKAKEKATLKQRARHLQNRRKNRDLQNLIGIAQTDEYQHINELIVIKTDINTINTEINNTEEKLHKLEAINDNLKEKEFNDDGEVITVYDRIVEETVENLHDAIQESKARLKAQKEEEERKEKERIRKEKEESIRQAEERLRREEDRLSKEEERLNQEDKSIAQEGERNRQEERRIRLYESYIRHNEEGLRQAEDRIRKDEESIQLREETIERIRQHEEEIYQVEVSMFKIEDDIYQNEEVLRQQRKRMRKNEEVLLQAEKDISQTEKDLLQAEKDISQNAEELKQLERQVYLEKRKSVFLSEFFIGKNDTDKIDKDDLDKLDDMSCLLKLNKLFRSPIIFKGSFVVKWYLLLLGKIELSDLLKIGDIDATILYLQGTDPDTLIDIMQELGFTHLKTGKDGMGYINFEKTLKSGYKFEVTLKLDLSYSKNIIDITEGKAILEGNPPVLKVDENDENFKRFHLACDQGKTLVGKPDKFTKSYLYRVLKGLIRYEGIIKFEELDKILEECKLYFSSAYPKPNEQEVNPSFQESNPLFFELREFFTHDDALYHEKAYLFLKLIFDIIFEKENFSYANVDNFINYLIKQKGLAYQFKVLDSRYFEGQFKQFLNSYMQANYSNDYQHQPSNLSYPPMIQVPVYPNPLAYPKSYKPITPMHAHSSPAHQVVNDNMQSPDATPPSSPQITSNPHILWLRKTRGQKKHKQTRQQNQTQSQSPNFNRRGRGQGSGTNN